ncbi:MAG: hypothetical protein AAGA09_07930 [Pseudomonadota bacterium]
MGFASSSARIAALCNDQRGVPMKLLHSIIRAIVAIFAILMILIGVILAPSPIPFGIILVALGFFLLAAVAPGFVRWLRRRWRWLDRLLLKLEDIMPRWITRHWRIPRDEDAE